MLLSLKDNPNPAPPEAYTETDRLAYGPRRWRRVQHLSDCFFKRWREEYLRTLTARQKWLTKEQSLQTNDVILIRDAAIKRNNWKLGRVLKAYVSDDGLVRSVTLSLSNSTTLGRPVSEWVLLYSPDVDCEVSLTTSGGECVGTILASMI